ncbi:MAG: cryptochrome/photolyase family protein [Patescibacteria group bacterium]
MHTATLIYGNQLFARHPALTHQSAHSANPVIMIEAHDLCTAYRYHKHKLVLVLAAMREYRNWLQKEGYTVYYTELSPDTIFLDTLRQVVSQHGIQRLLVVSPEDRNAASSLRSFATNHNLHLKEYDSPAFLTPREELRDWFSSYTARNKQPRMEQFYRWQRKRCSLLVTDGRPEGGAWNYDDQNRKPLPKGSSWDSTTSGIEIPKIAIPEPTAQVHAVTARVDELVPENPGETSGFWLPVTRAAALSWLTTFIDERLPCFGTYEDAMAQGEPFLFHSVLSPLLNIGLLTPDEAVDAAIRAYTSGVAPLNAVEGFVRQILGWREYMRGVYWEKDDLMEANFFGFNRELEDWWYTTAYTHQKLPIPLHEVLHTVHTYGYCHHIERLMVLGNWFLINEYNPKSVFRWFQSMFVDAYEWVMVPNVQGMSQYADGGFVATKPYIAGGNYLEKMGHWWGSAKKAKESQYTRRYWQFLKNNQDKLANNHRMKMVLAMARKR